MAMVQTGLVRDRQCLVDEEADMPAGQTELPPMGEGGDNEAAPQEGLGDSTAPDAPQSGKGKGAAGKGGETADKATA